MKTRLLTLVAVMFLGCGTLRAEFTFARGDGSSFKKAVVILGAKNEMAGVAIEDVWLSRKFPGSEKTSQALFGKDGKSYDKIGFTTARKQKRTVYFDITDFFGKY